VYAFEIGTTDTLHFFACSTLQEREGWVTLFQQLAGKDKRKKDSTSRYGVNDDGLLLEELIMDVKESGETVLDISNFHLFCWPDFIDIPYELPHMTELYLDDNELEELSEICGNFTCLQKLSMELNLLTSIPKVTCALPSLTHLNLSQNAISHIHANNLKWLTNVETLELAGNRISKLPSQIGLLTYLRSLDLSGNVLTTIPSSIAYCENLRKLNLSSCNLRSLPLKIFHCCVEMIELIFDDNQIANLPPEISSLTNLVSKERALPSFFSHISH